LHNLVQAKIYLKKGVEALDKNDFKKAEEFIKKALSFDPTNPKALETYDRFKSMKQLLNK